MTTSQIKRADTDVPSDTAEDVDTDATALEAAQEDADRIIAKARYDAFRMVTDARSEAEAILAEAKTAAGPAAPVAGTDPDAERRRDELADEIAELEELYARMSEKVAATRQLLTNLEGRLARIAGTAPASADEGSAPPAVEHHHTITVEVAPDEPDPLPPAASVDPATAVEMSEQGSFYSRRSANLPSIGASGGQSALSAVSSIRSRIDT